MREDQLYYLLGFIYGKLIRIKSEADCIHDDIAGSIPDNVNEALEMIKQVLPDAAILASSNESEE